MSPSEPPEQAQTPRRARGRAEVLFYRLLGFAFVGLGAIGAVLPLMPTTVFLLLAVWAFARGSPELGERLYAHPRFGPLLRDWDERRAIPVRAKVIAVIGMAVGLGIVIWRSDGPLAPAIASVVVLAGAAFVLTRPS
ncbi:YbaN family protein [Phenylobacterium sp.]|jgi:hypothetical protein|uniref:YbaN family protein n=1 Tax=Phenylobacterium sp. TaxID=1871053 RepID=UPI002E313B95|nr:YbaN family protein [Phenylobacterium sp.]HEX2562125.1 YbaN family protein [Phenylobacterium sp.]